MTVITILVSAFNLPALLAAAEQDPRHRVWSDSGRGAIRAPRHYPAGHHSVPPTRSRRPTPCFSQAAQWGNEE